MDPMSMRRYESVEEIMNAVAEMRDELALRGAPKAARGLSAALDCFYTTSSEYGKRAPTRGGLSPTAIRVRRPY